MGKFITAYKNGICQPNLCSKGFPVIFEDLNIRLAYITLGVSTNFFST
jgi:hypothetical protein